MDFSFTAEQESLRRSARQFLNEVSSSAQVRKAMASPDGFSREIWQRIANDLGWTMLVIPEQYGGAGGNQIDLSAVLGETGRALLCAPLFSTVCLATNALLLGGMEDLKLSVLPRIASGELRATVGWLDNATARSAPGGFLLSGRKAFVVDGATADLLIVSARLDGKTFLFAIPEDSKGVERVALKTLDQTRRLGDLVLNNVFVPASSRLDCRLGDVLNLAAMGLACEQVGGSERCLEMAVDYAKTRVQFNRPIGSFQAIKHRCAEMATRLEAARSAALYAAWAAAEAPEELHWAASAAKAYCSDAYFFCASENIQIHGGIGFTWEHDAHLFFKRAKSSETLLGDPSEHRAWLAEKVIGS